MYYCKLSVRSLVEFLYQSGDLISSSSSMERANLGSRIHRMLQAAATGDYQSEVFLSLESKIDDITFVIEGRADGVLLENDNVTIEEIKSTTIPYNEINDQHFVHFAQAYCYGYMYMIQHSLQQIDIKLTYYQIETQQIKTFIQHKTFEELETFYTDTLKAYLKWANLRKDIQEESGQSLRALTFPFPTYREGQRPFAIAVYKTILEGEVLFAQAPTGIGKTISTLFPALKAIGEGKIEKIFYLCAKNITASVAYDTIQLLYQQGVHFKTVGISAKDKICFLEERNCDPNNCPYAKGYYDRCGDALFELLQTSDFIDKACVSKIAKEHEVCPFELSLDASLYADVIVGDYNYAFDPRVYLKRFFSEKGDYVFLVDEAHNLVDRAREMYSAQLTKSSFLEVKRHIPKDRKVLLKAIQSVNATFLTLRKQCDEQTFIAQKEPIGALPQNLASFIEHMDSYFQSEHDESFDELLKDLYFQCIAYVKIADFYDEHFVTWLQKDGNDLTIKQYCMNPCNPIKGMMKRVKATIFFSATLSPIDYFLALLGGEEETKRLSLPSPFAPSQMKFIMNDAISTKYHARDHSLGQLLLMIHTCVMAKDGNYIVFCPSYAYMNKIAEAFQQQYPDITTSVQNGNMNEQEKQSFLDKFEIVSQLHVLFCVIGGMFSEGIDLKGDRLIGAIIVGVGLPQINPQQDLIKEHFQSMNHMGYAYAYQFPGMNKVLQAAGRVIRSHMDKGVIFFIDERFNTPLYRNLLPKHMAHYEIINQPDKLQASLASFWQGN